MSLNAASEASVRCVVARFVFLIGDSIRCFLASDLLPETNQHDFMKCTCELRSFVKFENWVLVLSKAAAM